MDRSQRRVHAILAFTATVLTVASATPAQAAGGAFAVDNAGVDDPGSCKVESWTAFARSGDRILSVAPACAVSLGRPVELGIQLEHVRFDRDWATGAILKAKTAIVPMTENSSFGIALSGGSAVSFETGKVIAWTVNVPVSVRLSETFQLNLKIGGLWDRIDDRSLFLWGTGFEFTLTERTTLIAEVFGIGPDHRGVQAGVRFTPHERVDFDFVYGHNIAGEQSDWLTLGMNVRF